MTDVFLGFILNESKYVATDLMRVFFSQSPCLMTLQVLHSYKPGWRVHRGVGSVLFLADVLYFASTAVPLHAQVLHLQVLVGRSRVQFEGEG